MVIGCKYHSHVPLNIFFAWQKCKFGLFLFCGEPDFLMVNSCLKDCSPSPPPQSTLQWEHKVSLLGTHVCISFEQEHFAPVDVLLFNCSQLFSFFFFSLLNCKDFQDNDGFCLFLPLLSLPHVSLHGHVLKPTLCRGGLIFSSPD